MSKAAPATTHGATALLVMTAASKEFLSLSFDLAALFAFIIYRSAVSQYYFLLVKRCLKICSVNWNRQIEEEISPRLLTLPCERITQKTHEIYFKKWGVSDCMLFGEMK